MACVYMQLNYGPLRPHTNSKECLVTAPLQLAAHTQLLLDATLMQADQLVPMGYDNFEVLHSPLGDLTMQA